MPECAKAHLQQSGTSNFFQWEDPGTPAFRGGEGKRETGKDKERRTGLEVGERKGKGQGRKGKGRMGWRFPNKNLPLYQCYSRVWV